MSLGLGKIFKDSVLRLGYAVVRQKRGFTTYCNRVARVVFRTPWSSSHELE